MLPGYDVTTWYGVFAPRDTPGAIIAKLNTTINESLKEEAVQKRLTTAGVRARLDRGGVRPAHGARVRALERGARGGGHSAAVAASRPLSVSFRGKAGNICSF